MYIQHTGWYIPYLYLYNGIKPYTQDSAVGVLFDARVDGISLLHYCMFLSSYRHGMVW